MNKANEALEALFMEFLESTHTGELAETMHKVSANIDRQIEAGNTDAVIDLTADHELAALRYGFYCGFLQAASIRA